MYNNSLSKAIDLKEELIDNIIPKNSSGIFLLGYTPKNNRKFHPLYISRCDCDIHHTLKEHIGYFSQFKFCLYNSISETFINECKQYHLLEDETFLINETHPSPPSGLLLRCPVCRK